MHQTERRYAFGCIKVTRLAQYKCNSLHKLLKAIGLAPPIRAHYKAISHMNQTIQHTGTHSLSSTMHTTVSVIQAVAMLAEQPQLRSKAAQIKVELQDGVLVLNGNLPSYFLKQLAQETLRPLGLSLSNRIRVG